MTAYVIEVWRDGAPGSGTLISRSFSNSALFTDFTRDTPVAGSHTYSVYVGAVSGSGTVGFMRMALLLAHR